MPVLKCEEFGRVHRGCWGLYARRDRVFRSQVVMATRWSESVTKVESELSTIGMVILCHALSLWWNWF